jgi:two-component system, NtrC family, C4-dicarboxylate transport sensor histidine kinase DctB
LGRSRHQVWGLVVLCAAALVGVAVVATHLARGVYLEQGQRRAEATLDLTLRVLDGHLQRYEAVPDLLADSDNLRALLESPDDPVGRMALNIWLARKRAQLDALDIYVITPDGQTIAASNYDRDDSFIGENFSYRPYFQQAIAGNKGRFYAIGTTSGVRGYYFAAPVRGRTGTITGVVVVKIGLDVTEAEWRSQSARIMVTDPDGIVFMSSYPAWLNQGLLPLTPERMARAVRERRYADRPLRELPHQLLQEAGVTRISLANSNGSPHEYIMASKLLPRAEMTVRVLLDTGEVYAQARLAVLAVMLFVGATVAGLGVVLQRRARLAERFALQEQTKAELERRVALRTADLARVNTLIEAEVAERRLTEAELRRTQGDLVQAGKLAALSA